MTNLLDRLHWLWLLLAAPFMLFPTPKRTLSMLVVPGLWILHWLVTRRASHLAPPNSHPAPPNSHPLTPDSQPAPRTSHPLTPNSLTPLNGSLLLLSIMMLVSTWATYDIAQSLEKISGLVLGFGIYFAVLREARKPLGWWMCTLTFWGGGMAFAALGLLGPNWPARFSFLAPLLNRVPELIPSFPEAAAGLHHNAVGGTIIWVLPSLLVMTVYLWHSFRSSSSSGEQVTNLISRVLSGDHPLSWPVALLLGLSTLFLGFVLLLTQSRGSYLALGITLLGMLFIVLPRRWRWVLVVTVIVALVVLMAVIHKAGGWEGFIALLGLSGETGASLDTLEGRLELWSRAIYGVQDFSFTGMGMNTFREVVHVLYPLFLIAPDVDIAHAHNEYLQAALDLGIPGLIAFLALHILAFWMLWDVWKNVQTFNVQRYNVLGLGGGLAAHMLFGLTDAITLGAKPGLFFWILLGLIAGLHQQLTSH